MKYFHRNYVFLLIASALTTVQMCIRDSVLSVVQSESATISNTNFFAITILPFLKEYGIKMLLQIILFKVVHLRRIKPVMLTCIANKVA